MVGRLIRVALITQAEADFQFISQLFASLDHLAYRLEWLGGDDTVWPTLDPAQYDVCLADEKTLSFHLDPGLQASSSPLPNLPIILLYHCPPSATDFAQRQMSIMDWLPMSNLPAKQLERAICYVLERHRLLEALRVAQDAADSARRMQNTFLATISDEIRTPMNGVIGMAELLMEMELPEEQRECVNTIRTSGRRLSAVIDDLLDMSKLKAGYTCLEQKAFKLHKLADGVMMLFAEQAQLKGLDFTWSISEDIPEVVVGDPSLLQQLLINLTSNAVKFTQAGYIDIRFVLEDETEDQFLICVELEDTGIGIPQELHEHMFQQFAQADAGNSRKRGGAGLGLAIARHIVHALQGSITFESKPAQGSTFWCKFHLFRPTSA